MPEIRRDPIVGYWTIISQERSRRPAVPVIKKNPEERECPFCEGKEKQTTHEVYALRAPGTKANAPGWDVRVIQSKVPLLSPELGLEREGMGMYDTMQGAGTHEIIIESPHHDHDLDELSDTHLEKVVSAYVNRINELEKDPRFQYALLFKNHGLISGGATDIIRHTRSQLIATPVTPKRVKEELQTTRSYFERHDRCVFCDMLKQEMREGVRKVVENESFFAFCPFASRSPFEIWILPKAHCADFGRLEPARFMALGKIIKESLRRINKLLDDPPFNFILHTAPYRKHKPRTHWTTLEEDYHWYLQISPKLTSMAGFEWGTGMYINPTPPEEAAMLLREAL